MSELAFFERGDGEKPVLMLHGYLGSARNLGSLSQKLCEARPDLKLFVCDLPGHGGSAPLSSPPTFESLVGPIQRFVSDLAQRFGQPVAAVGHSMGGRVSLAVSQRAPVSQVVLLDIAPGPIGDRNKDLEVLARALVEAPAVVNSRDEMRDHLLGVGLSRMLSDWLLMNLVGNGDTLVWRLDRDALVALGRATRDDDLWAAAENLGPQLSCAYGERSGFVHTEDVLRLTELGAKVVAIANAGHFVHVEALEFLTQTLASLITR
jgi:esterase